jgi:hypothetical protein
LKFTNITFANFQSFNQNFTFMKQFFSLLVITLFSLGISTQEVTGQSESTKNDSGSEAQEVQLVDDESGIKLLVDGKPLMINGMNWDYFPIGTNFSYSLWSQTDGVIRAALDAEMSILRNMGVNAIRVYTGIQP